MVNLGEMEAGTKAMQQAGTAGGTDAAMAKQGDAGDVRREDDHQQRPGTGLTSMSFRSRRSGMSARSLRSKRPVSIATFDVTDTREGDPVFTPRSMLALERQGVVPAELAGRAVMSFKDDKVPEDIWKARYEHFDQQRMQLIHLVKEEYKKVLRREEQMTQSAVFQQRTSSEAIGVDMEKEEEKIVEQYRRQMEAMKKKQREDIVAMLTKQFMANAYEEIGRDNERRAAEREREHLAEKARKQQEWLNLQVERQQKQKEEERQQEQMRRCLAQEQFARDKEVEAKQDREDRERRAKVALAERARVLKAEETQRVAAEAAAEKYRIAMKHKEDMEALEAQRISRMEAMRGQVHAENERKRLESEERVRAAHLREHDMRERMLRIAEEKDRRVEEKRLAFEEQRRREREDARWQAEEKERHIKQVLQDMENKQEENRLNFDRKEQKARERYITNTKWKEEEEKKKAELQAREEKRLWVARKAAEDIEARKQEILDKFKAHEEHVKHLAETVGKGAEERKRRDMEEREKKRQTIAHKAAEDLEKKREQMLNKQYETEQALANLQRERELAELRRGEKERMMRADRQMAIRRLQRIEEASRRRHAEKIRSDDEKLRELQAQRYRLEQEKVRIKTEQEQIKQALVDAVERMRQTQKWDPPAGVDIEIDVEEIKRAAEAAVRRSEGGSIKGGTSAASLGGLGPGSDSAPHGSGVTAVSSRVSLGGGSLRAGSVTARGTPHPPQGKGGTRQQQTPHSARGRMQNNGAGGNHGVPGRAQAATPAVTPTEGGAAERDSRDEVRSAAAKLGGGGGGVPRAPPPGTKGIRPSPRPAGSAGPHPPKRKKLDNEEEKVAIVSGHATQRVLVGGQIEELRRQQNRSLLSVLETERQLEAARERRLLDVRGGERERLEVIMGEERAAASQRIMDVVGHHERELKLRMQVLNYAA